MKLCVFESCNFGLNSYNKLNFYPWSHRIISQSYNMLMGRRPGSPEVTGQLKRAAGSTDTLIQVWVCTNAYTQSLMITCFQIELALQARFLLKSRLWLHFTQFGCYYFIYAFPPAVINFPCLQPILHFPLLSTNQILPCVTSQLHVFPRIFPVTCTILGSDCCSWQFFAALIMTERFAL